jgi:hypothetical protein
MSQILGIPVPSLEQIIVGTELVFILYIPKRMVSQLDREFRKERNRIIHRHVKSGHSDRLKQCADQDCSSLRRQGPQQLGYQPEMVDLELQ